MCCLNTENVVFGSFILYMYSRLLDQRFQIHEDRLFCWDVTDIQTDRHQCHRSPVGTTGERDGPVCNILPDTRG